MDTKTRAEKIKGIVYDLALLWCPEQHEVCPEADAIVDRIISQLDEAVREASHSEPDCKTCIAKGFAAAREKAGGVAENAKSDRIWTAETAGIRIATKNEIAERIRAMEADK